MAQIVDARLADTRDSYGLTPTAFKVGPPDVGEGAVLPLQAVKQDSDGWMYRHMAHGGCGAASGAFGGRQANQAVDPVHVCPSQG